MDRLFCMQVFVRVVEHGAFGRAADALGVARATVSEAVVQLEKRLGVRLLNRTTRRVSLTSEGSAYYASSVRILGEIAEADDGVLGGRLAPRGRLRVSVPQSFTSAIFFPALTDFTRRYPDLEIEIVLTDRAVNLVEEGIDCALRGVEIPPDSELVARTLSVTNWLTCAAPGYLAVHGAPGTIEALADHNCIRLISQSTGRPRDWVFSDGDRRTAMVPAGNLRVTSFDAVIQLALSGSGIVQIPDLLGFAAVSSGQLTPILVDKVACAPPLVLVYAANRYLPAKVRAFMEYMSDVFPREGWWARIVGEPARKSPGRSGGDMECAAGGTATQGG